MILDCEEAGSAEMKSLPQCHQKISDRARIGAEKLPTSAKKIYQEKPSYA